MQNLKPNQSMKKPINRSILIPIILLLALALLGGDAYLNQNMQRSFSSSNEAISTSTKLKTPDNRTKAKSNKMTEQQVIALAVNELSQNDDGFLHLTNPNHSATYSREEGFTFSPIFSELKWNWQLSHFGSAERNWLRGERPKPRDLRRDVEFDYGPFTERYLAKAESIEQRFILHRKPGALSEGENLVIRGDIKCPGEFDDNYGEQVGWVWRGKTVRDTVSLGQVTVFDASGKILPATMTATAEGSEITVEGAALLAANYPVTVDPEIGTDDFLIGGSLADPGAHRPRTIDSAFHRDSQTHLVIWTSDEPNGRRVLYGNGFRGYINAPLDGPQLIAEDVIGTPKVAADDVGFLVTWISSSTGRCVGRFVADHGIPYSAEFDITPDPVSGSRSPAVAGDPDGDFLVAWVDEDNQAHMRTVGGDSVDINLSTPVTVDDDVHAIRIAHNPIRGEYCLAWRRTATKAIRARQVSEAGVFVHPTATLITPDSTASFPGRELTVCFNPDDREYLFSWNLFAGSRSNVTNLHGRMFSEDLIPRTTAFPITNFTDPVTLTRWHKCTYVSAFRKYLVSWLEVGDSTIGVRTQLVDPITRGLSGVAKAITGADVSGFDTNSLPTGINVRPLIFTLPYIPGGGGATGAETISAIPLDENFGELLVVEDAIFPVGIGGDFELGSAAPAIAHNEATQSYAVVWQQELDSADDWHILGRQVADNGATTVTPVVVLSDSGLLQNNTAPAVAAKPGGALVVWQGDQFVPGVFTGLKTEVHGAYWDLAANTVGNPFQISATGSQSRTSLKAGRPDVAAGSDDDFVVVWSANAEAGAVLPGTPQIYRRVAELDSGNMGSILQVSDHLSPGAPAEHPAITFGSAAEGYQIVWQGSPTGSNELEIFGRRLRASGSPLGIVRQISTMGPDGHLGFEGRTPDVAFGTEAGFFVVWAGEHDATADTEIYARYLSSNAPQIGLLQVSNMGQTGSFAYLWKPSSPSVAYNTDSKAYVVTWSSSHNTPGLSAQESEIYARSFFLANPSNEQERISTLGEDGDSTIDAERPAVAAGPGARFLVVFDGNDTEGAFNEDRTGIFGQGYEAGEQLASFAEILSLELNGEDVIIRWRSTNAGVVSFETSTDLKTWEPAGEENPSGGEIKSFTHIGGAIGDTRFYRVLGDSEAP